MKLMSRAFRHVRGQTLPGRWPRCQRSRLGYSVWMFWTRSLCCASLLIILGGRAADAQTSAGPAEEVLQRVMPQLAPQFQLRLRSPGKEGDSFRVSGTAGHIRVEGGTLPTLLNGVNWYLKYVAHLQVSTNGSNLAEQAWCCRDLGGRLKGLHCTSGAMP